jgi:hypothetical protein
VTLPSFLIIGAMKAGSTSLFRWLGAHPAIALPADKEPAFFSSDARWARGLEHYEAGFPGALNTGQITGEASVVYTDPAVSAQAARRARTVLPSLNLVFLARDPVERMRSHYRHQVQRGRERLPFAEALQQPEQPYVRCSMYCQALAPWLERFGRDRLCTIRFESLIRDDTEQWSTALDFLGLAPIERPGGAHNVTSDKQGFSPVMRRLFDAGAGRYEHLLPRGLKRAVKPLLFRSSARYERLLSSSRDPVPDDVRQVLQEDFAKFEGTIGWGVATSPH